MGIQDGTICRKENIWTDITLVMCLKDYLKFSIQVPNSQRIGGGRGAGVQFDERMKKIFFFLQ